MGGLDFRNCEEVCGHKMRGQNTRFPHNMGSLSGFPHVMGVFMITCEIVCGMVFIWKLSQSKEIMLKKNICSLCKFLIVVIKRRVL